MYHANAELIEENVIKINGEVTINVNVSGKIIIYVKKDHIWNPATCSCKNRKYLGSITDDSVIMCDEIIDMDAGSKLCNKETKTLRKYTICESKSFFILLAFLLIIMAYLRAVSIYCYLIK